MNRDAAPRRVVIVAQPTGRPATPRALPASVYLRGPPGCRAGARRGGTDGAAYGRMWPESGGCGVARVRGYVACGAGGNVAQGRGDVAQGWGLRGVRGGATSRRHVASHGARRRVTGGLRRVVRGDVASRDATSRATSRRTPPRRAPRRVTRRDVPRPRRDVPAPSPRPRTPVVRRAYTPTTPPRPRPPGAVAPSRRAGGGPRGRRRRRGRPGRPSCAGGC